MLKDSHYRQRFVTVCLGGKEAAKFRSLFDHFMASLADWRWGAVAQAVRSVLKLQLPLRLFYSTNKMLGVGAQEGEAHSVQVEEGALEGADRAQDDAHTGNKYMVKAGEATGSAFFWGFASMVAAIDDTLVDFEAWIQGCECHGPLGHEGLRLAVGSGKFACPNMGRKLHLLAAGQWKDVIANIAQERRWALLQDLVQANPETRGSILQDWVRGQGRLVSTLAVKFAYTSQLPHRLAAVAINDESVARFEAITCQSLWDQRQASLPANLEHRLVKMFFDGVTNPVLFSEFKEFMGGAPLDNLPELRLQLGLLRMTPLNESGIEGKHAAAKLGLRTNCRPSPASVSLAVRLPEWKRRFRRHPGAAADVVKSFEMLVGGGGGLMHAIVRELGFANHPFVATEAFAPARQSRRPGDAVRVFNRSLVMLAVYHCDPLTLYSSHAVACKRWKEQKWAEARMIRDHEKQDGNTDKRVGKRTNAKQEQANAECFKRFVSDLHGQASRHFKRFFDPAKFYMICFDDSADFKFEPLIIDDGRNQDHRMGGALAYPRLLDFTKNSAIACIIFSSHSEAIDLTSRHSSRTTETDKGSGMSKGAGPTDSCVKRTGRGRQGLGRPLGGYCAGALRPPFRHKMDARASCSGCRRLVTYGFVHLTMCSC